MPAQPRGEADFVQIASGQGQHVGDAVGVFRRQAITIECQEQFRSDKRGALVAINERMIAGNAERMACRQVRGVGFAVMGQLQRACKC